MNYLRFLIVGFVLQIFIFLFPQSIFAHSGGGPPFVKVNDKFADTNPYSSRMEDKTKEMYLVGSPVHFLIDTNALNVPKEIAQNSTFRWAFSEGDTSYVYGTDVMHAFNAPKTYFVTLDVLGPGVNSYINLDIVQVNIVNDLSYQIPSLSLSVYNEGLNVNNPVFFQSLVSVDKSSRIGFYYWEFGDGATSKESNPSHLYKGKEFSYLVSIRITDSNGYIGDGGLVVSSDKGKLLFENPFNNGKKIQVFDHEPNKADKKSSSNAFPFIIVVIGIGMGGIFAFLFVFKRSTISI